MRSSKVWIIDDNPVDSYVIKTMLELNELAKDIHIFSNNEEAIASLDKLNKINSNDSILIITENKTNAVNGWSLMEQLSEKVSKNKNDLKLKFHMTSEKYSENDLKKFEETGPLQSLNKKPLRLGQLIKMVNS